MPRPDPAREGPVLAVASGGTYRRVLETIGTGIVAGASPVGSTETVEGLVQRTGASRSIVREAVRVLVSLGMLSAGRRVGLRVLPRTEWNLLDPQVIRWRLASADRPAQLAELRGLRAAIEPEAARLAAGRRTEGQLDALRTAARDLAAATDPAQREAFLDADRRLHGLVLQCSGNALFLRLQTTVDEALRDRAVGDGGVGRLDPHDVALHHRVVQAVAAGDGEQASLLMRQVIERTG